MFPNLLFVSIVFLFFFICSQFKVNLFHIISLYQSRRPCSGGREKLSRSLSSIPGQNGMSLNESWAGSSQLGIFWLVWCPRHFWETYRRSEWRLTESAGAYKSKNETACKKQRSTGSKSCSKEGEQRVRISTR